MNNIQFKPFTKFFVGGYIEIELKHDKIIQTTCINNSQNKILISINIKNLAFGVRLDKILFEFFSDNLKVFLCNGLDKNDCINGVYVLKNKFPATGIPYWHGESKIYLRICIPNLDNGMKVNITSELNCYISSRDNLKPNLNPEQKNFVIMLEQI